MCKYSALKRYSLLWISFFCWTTWNEYCLFDGLHFSIWKTCHRFILNFYCVANNKSGKILTLPKLIWIGLCEFVTFGHLSYSWKQICSSSFRLDWFYWCKAFFCLAFDWAITNHSTCLESLAEWNRSCLRISRYSPLASVLTSIPLVHSVCARYCIFFSVWEVKTLVLSNQRIFLRIFGNSPTPYFGELQCLFFNLFIYLSFTSVEPQLRLWFNVFLQTDCGGSLRLLQGDLWPL